MPGVIWTAVAAFDLEEILFYIGVEAGRPLTAERIGVEIRDAVERYYRLGSPRRTHPALPQHWSYLLHKRWLIAFEPVDDGIVVRRVLDASRDLPDLFESQEE